MVTTDNLFLEGALLVYDNIDPLKVSPTEYAAKPSIADAMDVVIFDDYTPDVLPPSPASLLFFHPTGEHSPFAIRGMAQTPHITEVDEGHPVMRWVTMSDVYMDKSEVFAPDSKKGESTVAFSVTDPIIVAKREGRRKILAFGFSLPANGRDSATDLPMRVAFPMLLVNTLDWFAGDQADLLTTYATGSRERVPLDGVVGATEAEVKGPASGSPRSTARRSATTISPRRRTARRSLRSTSPRTSRRRANPISHRRARSRSAARSSRRPRRSRSRTARSCGSICSSSRPA